MRERPRRGMVLRRSHPDGAPSRRVRTDADAYDVAVPGAPIESKDVQPIEKVLLWIVLAFRVDLEITDREIGDGW